MHLIRMVEGQILEMEDMSEIISLLKTFKGIKIGEKLGFFQSLLTGMSILAWSDIIRGSTKEDLNMKYIK